MWTAPCLDTPGSPAFPARSPGIHINPQGCAPSCPQPGALRVPHRGSRAVDVTVRGADGQWDTARQDPRAAAAAGWSGLDLRPRAVTSAARDHLVGGGRSLRDTRVTTSLTFHIF